MSQKRRVKRAQTKVQRGQALQQAMGDVQGLVSAMGGTQGMEALSQLPSVLGALQEQTSRAGKLADAMVEDHELLLGKITALENEVVEFRARLQALEHKLGSKG